MDKQLAQILVSQYIRGNIDARPRPGYNPRPEGTGPYPNMYHEGYTDGGRIRKLLLDAPIDHLREKEEEGVHGRPADPRLAFELVKVFREVQAQLDSRIQDVSQVYRILTEAAADYIAGADERELQARIDAAVAARVDEAVSKALGRTIPAPAPTEPGGR